MKHKKENKLFFENKWKSFFKNNWHLLFGMMIYLSLFILVSLTAPSGFETIIILLLLAILIEMKFAQLK